MIAVSTDKFMLAIKDGKYSIVSDGGVFTTDKSITYVAFDTDDEMRAYIIEHSLVPEE